MYLSIIIVNYKTPALLLNCIGSVIAAGTDGIEIIVVDNDSRDETETMLQEQFPSVRFIQMGYNAGFARANNAGIRVAEGKAVLLLNSDTVILGNAVNISMVQLLASETYIACGVQLLNEDGSAQISGNYAMRGGINYLLPLPYLGSFLKFVAGIFNLSKPNVPEATGTVEVDWINGAYLMVKKAAIEKAGMLDEDFFLYAEEAEWCSRLKEHGKLCIYGEEKVTHLQGQTANDAFASGGSGYFNLFDKKGLQIMLSNFVRMRKEFGTGWFIFNLLIYVAAIPVFLFGWLLSNLFTGGKSRYTYSQWKGYTQNIFKMLGYTLTIIRNRPYFYKVL